MTEKQIGRILKKGTVQESYDKWSEEVQNNIREVEKIFRQNPKFDNKYQNKENAYENKIMIERIKLRYEHIIDRMKENRNRRIIKVAQQIKSNVDKCRKIWEIKRKVQRNNQTPHTIRDKKQQN